MFSDDVYAFEYLWREDCVTKRNPLLCTTEVGGAAKNTIYKISNITYDTTRRKPISNTRKHIRTSIIHTVAKRKSAQRSNLKVHLSNQN